MEDGIDIYRNYILPAATGVKNQLVNLFAPTDTSALPYASQLASVARQQKLADMLTQIGAQDIPVSTAGGITAPISPWAALAKGLQSGAGSYMSAKAAADEAGLQKSEKADAISQLSALYKLPDTTGLVQSTEPAGTTSTPYSFDIPTLPGQKPSGQTVTANLDMPNIPRTEVGKIPGAARPYAEQQQMLNQWALGDNKNLAALAPVIAAQLKPTYVEQAAGSTMYENVNGVMKPTGLTGPLKPITKVIPDGVGGFLQESTDSAGNVTYATLDTSQIPSTGGTPSGGTPPIIDTPDQGANYPNSPNIVDRATHNIHPNPYYKGQR